MRVYIRRIPSVDTGAEVRQGKLTLFDFRTLFLPGILIADIYFYIYESIRIPIYKFSHKVYYIINK